MTFMRFIEVQIYVFRYIPRLFPLKYLVSPFVHIHLYLIIPEFDTF